MASHLNAILFGDNPSAYVSKCLSRLELEGSAEILYALIAYDGDILTVTSTDGNQTWKGKVTGKELAGMAKDIKMSSNDFIAETLKALTRQKMGSMSYVYSTRPSGGDGLQLSWKRCLKADNIKFELGSVTLVSTSPRTANSCIFDYAVETIGTLNNEIIRLVEEKSNLRSEWDGALLQLETCAQLKENLEKDLYGKFRLILNDKKSKIRRLMDQLSHLSEQHGQLSESHDNTPVMVLKKDDPADMSSDSEAEMESPSKSKVSAECDSLFDQGHLDPTVGPPLVKRRRREPHVPSKSAEIPQPPSIKNRDGFKPRKSSIEVNESMDSDKLLGLL